MASQYDNPRQESVLTTEDKEKLTELVDTIYPVCSWLNLALPVLEIKLLFNWVLFPVFGLTMSLNLVQTISVYLLILFIKRFKAELQWNQTKLEKRWTSCGHTLYSIIGLILITILHFAI